MEILIEPMQDEERSDQVSGLLRGLEVAGLCKLSSVIRVTTEDEQVAALVARYGRRLDVVPVVVPVATKSRKGIGGQRGGRQKKVYAGPIPMPEPMPESAPEPLPEPMPGSVPDPEPATEPSPEPMLDAEPKAVIAPVVKKKKAGRPTRGITPALENDLRRIVAEAGRKALNESPLNGSHQDDEHPVDGKPAGERSPETTYTNPLTGAQISYLEMRGLLRDRRVNARERFVSSRQGLMEVYDKGTKLILVQVAE